MEARRGLFDAPADPLFVSLGNLHLFSCFPWSRLVSLLQQPPSLVSSASNVLLYDFFIDTIVCTAEIYLCVDALELVVLPIM